MAGTRLHFGVFEFEPGSNELRRNGIVVRLQGQPAQVLACLLAHAGEVASREELRSAVWTTGTFVDFERGLNFCIAQIRGALKDDALAPRFIRTVPKRGYQFIAPVERIEPMLDADESAAAVASLPLGRIMLLSLAAITLFAAGYWSRGLAGSTRTPIVAIVRFDNETGNPDLGRVADGLTDDLVVDLTAASGGQFRVIGNARILRGAREQRDLRSIASGLGASYVVLGQVQLSGGRTRILAHLIHMPEQTHVWVTRHVWATRMDRSPIDPLTLESEVAEAITSQFSPRINSRSIKSFSPAAVSR